MLLCERMQIQLRGCIGMNILEYVLRFFLKKHGAIGHLYCMLKTCVNVITTDVCYGEGYFSLS